MISWEAYAQLEKENSERVSVKLAYIDMVGDLAAGLLLSQIVYWHLPNSNGNSKLAVQHEGHYWVAKTRHDWWHETRLTARQVDRALQKIAKTGIIEMKVFKFNGAPTTHIRLDIEKFLEVWSESKSPNGNIRNHQMVSSISRTGDIHVTQTVISLTDTTTETTTNIENPLVVEADPKPSDELKARANQLLDYLNRATAREGASRFKSYAGLRARLEDGATDDDIRLVVDFKSMQWANDEKMRQFIRPKTLFGPQNFPGYLSEANAWNAKGRPSLTDNNGKRRDGSGRGADYYEQALAKRRGLQAHDPTIYDRGRLGAT